MKILAVVLLLLPLSDCWVVEDFTVSCPQFFYRVGNVLASPTRFPGERYKQICQKTQNREPFFATFYDTENRIPIYSVYRIDMHKENNRTKRKKGAWFIEPQLDEPWQNNKIYMNYQSSVEKSKRGSKQALNNDYKNSDFDRGHLLPVFYAHDQDCATATFTLTNAAPQYHSFNIGGWKRTEGSMAILLKKYCKHDVYAVTGVVPGNKYLQKVYKENNKKSKKVNKESDYSQFNKDRVRIPSHFWAAYCCVQDNKFIHSAGYIAENKHNGNKLLIIHQ